MYDVCCRDGELWNSYCWEPRRDIATEYSKLLGEVGLFAENGASILIKHKWMERPPHAVDRNELMK
ncbi:DUF3231 family protein [Metabacillus endolithicus]|uniref:DUF3231 family protein n=1 Tax=Metabacillus endolithicus TaxID=1535204 RepID=UPI003CD0C50C